MKELDPIGRVHASGAPQIHQCYQHKNHLAHHHVVTILQCTGFPNVEIVNIVCTTFVLKKVMCQMIFMLVPKMD